MTKRIPTARNPAWFFRLTGAAGADKAAGTMKEGTPDLVRRLFRENFRQHLPTYLFAIFCMALAAASTAAIAWMMRDIINDIFVSRNSGVILGFAIAIVAISAARGASTYFYTVALAKIGNSVTASLQQRLIRKLLSMRVEFFSNKHSSQFVTRISQNAKAAQAVIITLSTTLGRDLMTVLALIAVMIVQDPLLSLIAFSVSPPALLGISRIVRRLRNLSSEEYGAMANVIAATQEALGGLKVVKSFTLEDEMATRVRKAVVGLEARANKVIRIQASTSPLMETLGGVSIGLVILYAGWQTLTVGKTPGEFMAFVAAFLLAYEPAKRLARLHINLQRPLKGVAMLYELLDQDAVESPDEPEADALAVKGAIAFENVRFGYRKTPVLEGVTLAVAPGSMVALTGESGVGKSTIFSLLLRFYEPWSGTITIDGRDIRDIPLKQLRRNIAFVSQDSVLFSGTVAQNIRLGSPGASDAQVRAAADAAHATEFIEKLPLGFDSEIAENGGNLSGGQRQRISIARALLKNAPILLLDEATSALDDKSDRIVRSAIENLTKDRTTLIIAHRLSTIMGAQYRYELRNGVIETCADEAEGQGGSLTGTDTMETLDR